uniref:Transmembrane protein 180 n=1 Tax=Phallusia mammillata TaxID=59560 RepID=A0A6F9DVJ5_9ASCI|nr:transmembrane protein 180 [Phallusia mammillata]
MKYRARNMVLHRNAVAYAATTLASSLMNSVFFFYYVNLFLNHYKVPNNWFQFAQVVYMLWNAINDPLFGYLQDNSNWALCRSRKKAVYYGAPIWALTFLLPWFPWADYEKFPAVAGLHLIVTLCAYDAMLTFVLLAQCALFAEISTKPEDRLRLIKYNQIASVLGSTSVFWSSLVSENMTNFHNLKLFCVLIAIIAFLCLRYSSTNVVTAYEGNESKIENEGLLSKESENFGVAGAFRTTKEIILNKNFMAFVTMNFFQVFHVTFCSNFMLIFADHLIPKGVLPSVAMSALYGASFILPQILILLGGNIIAKFGVYRVVMVTFFLQAAAAIIVYLCGRNVYWLLAFFFILDMTLPSLAFSLFNVPLSDIIDEDKRVYERRTPQSSMVFGTNALITKPANSLAPMIVVTILNNYGYEQLKDIKTAEDLGASNSEGDLDNLHAIMFSSLCFIPFVLSLVQVVVWSFYGLKNNHSVEAKYTEA